MTKETITLPYDTIPIEGDVISNGDYTFTVTAEMARQYASREVSWEYHHNNGTDMDLIERDGKKVIYD